MGKYHQYVRKPRRFLVLTGYTGEEFASLLPEFERQFYARRRTHWLDGKPRGHRCYCDYATIVRCPPAPTSSSSSCTISKPIISRKCRGCFSA